MQSLQWIVEYEWARHALIAGIGVATLCSLLSVIVVLKRMAFIGQGVSHSAFGGVGAAVFFGVYAGSPWLEGWCPTWLIPWLHDAFVLAFCLAAAFGIAALSEKREVEPDSAIGILLVAAMAFGVLMDNLAVAFQEYGWYVRTFGARGNRPGFEALLFGSLLNVDAVQAAAALVAAALVLAVGAMLIKEIVFFTFDERVSAVFGVPRRLIHHVLLTMISVAIVISIRLAGVILVTALLVIPGATALMISRRFGSVLAWAWAVGMIGTIGGLLLSLEAGNLSTGPCIVAVLGVVFFLVYLTRTLRETRVG